jgi:hypothetical protein
MTSLTGPCPEPISSLFSVSIQRVGDYLCLCRREEAETVSGAFDIVTYVRFPWLNNVSTAVTMDSTTLLHFLSNATIETETFQLLWRVIYKRESSNERSSWV